MCRLIRIYCKLENQQQGIFPSRVFLKSGYGIEGDSHGGKPGRHISIMLSKTKDKIAALPLQGLCTDRFRENILIKGDIDLSPGSILDIGEAKITITSVGKKCFKDCNIYSKDNCCPMREVLFADVVSSGFIEVGDSIKRDS